MSEKQIDPELKKAIWKIVVYAVTILASLFAGNAAAKNGYKFTDMFNSNNIEYVCQKSE